MVFFFQNWVKYWHNFMARLHEIARFISTFSGGGPPSPARYEKVRKIVFFYEIEQNVDIFSWPECTRLHEIARFISKFPGEDPMPAAGDVAPSALVGIVPAAITSGDLGPKFRKVRHPFKIAATGLNSVGNSLITETFVNHLTKLLKWVHAMSMRHFNR